MSRSLVVCLVVFSTACGTGNDITPREECEDTSSALCERMYACMTAAEVAAAGLPASEAACVTSYEASRGCAAQTLQNVCVNGNATYNGDEASHCTVQITNLTCAEILDPAFSLAASAPSCAQVCQIAQ